MYIMEKCMLVSLKSWPGAVMSSLMMTHSVIIVKCHLYLSICPKVIRFIILRIFFLSSPICCPREQIEERFVVPRKWMKKISLVCFK